MKQTLLKFFIKIDSLLFNKLSNHTAKATPETERCFDALQEIVTEAKKLNVPIWVNGSLALTLHSGKLTKSISDIDLITNNFGIKLLSELLKKLGYRNGKSKWPRMILFQRDGIEVEFYSTEDNEHILNKTPFYPDRVEYKNFTYPVISRESLTQQYVNLLFRKGRNVRSDLKKLRLLMTKS